MHNIEAERAIIGAILLDDRCLDQIDLKAEDFYSQLHRDVYTAARELESKRIKVDLISLNDHFSESGKKFNIAEIAEITSTIASNANLGYYCQKVKQIASRRLLAQLGAFINESVRDKTVSTPELIDSVEKKITDLTMGNGSGDYAHVKTYIPGLIERMQKAAKTKGAIEGVQTGFQALDELVMGFRNQEYVIIGARPSIGKTAFMLSMIERIAVVKKIPCGFFSIEMGQALLLDRMIASRSGISASKIGMGMLTAQDMGRINNATESIHNAPFYIDDTAGIKMAEIRSKARRMVRKDGVKIIFVDYFSLIGSDDDGDPWNVKAVISKQLKQLAKELNIPIVVLSQVTRQVEGKRPGLADLRDTGSIEQDADIVIFLHRERDDKGLDRIETEVVVAKNRNGATGMVKLDFEPAKIRFLDKTP